MTKHSTPVLVLEDLAEDLHVLEARLSLMGFEVLAATTVTEAMDLLKTVEPVIAVIDWLLDDAPDGIDTSESVVIDLARRYPGTHVFIYSRGVSDALIKRQLLLGNPSATVVDKNFGIELLLQVITKRTNKKMGDLTVAGGAIIHRPSGDIFTHRDMIRLAYAYPDTAILLSEGKRREALRSFRAWLAAHDSSVEVVRWPRHQRAGLRVIKPPTA